MLRGINWHLKKKNIFDSTANLYTKNLKTVNEASFLTVGF